MIYLAPMIDVSTKYFRRFIRLYCQKTVLFTEMICVDYILNNSDFLSRIGPYDKNTIIQIGGCCPTKVALAVKKIIDCSKFRQFNLNCGCPSTRVQNGFFGALLMKNPSLVCKIINRTFETCGVILSIKCRNGVDEFDSYEYFSKFINEIITTTNCREFYIHSRKCWLKGLSPAENRTIPPIDYTYAYRIKEKYGKKIRVILNGNINNLKPNEHVDGLMLGRAAYNNIFIFASQISLREKCEIILTYLSFYEKATGFILKPLYFIFRGERNSRTYRQLINKNLNQKTVQLRDELKNFFYENNF